jgi:hypothetical protein
MQWDSTGIEAKLTESGVKISVCGKSEPRSSSKPGNWRYFFDASVRQ